MLYSQTKPPKPESLEGIEKKVCWRELYKTNTTSKKGSSFQNIQKGSSFDLEKPSSRKGGGFQNIQKGSSFDLENPSLKKGGSFDAT